MEEHILFSKGDGVARVTFNRPAQRNPISSELIAQLLDFLCEVEGDPAIRCVVITGKGDHFCAGGDVKGMAEWIDSPPADRGQRLERKALAAAPLVMVLERMPQIVIVSMRGAVAGGGMSLLGAADLAIASDTVKLILAQTNLGIVPDMGATYFLARDVGLKRAKEIALLGGMVTAAEALAMGLVNRVCADDALEAETEALVARIANGPMALSQVKSLINASLNSTLTEQLYLETRALAAAGSSRDFAEGVHAFQERRAPKYTGV